MSWTEGRRRPICKKVMFAPEEWERAERLRQALMKESLRAAIAYRRWGEYARERLLYPVVEMPRVVLASDPEVFKSELHQIGTNVNQMARVANMSGAVTPAQLDELRRQLDRITELMEGMERAKEEMEARGGSVRDGHCETRAEGQDEPSGHARVCDQSRQDGWRPVRVREL